ncbi:MAG: DUF1836 domain-containing protein [Clostridia bacterium]|nr:DUF1836 domain-containing protein [Clostridia bacterium]
MNVQRTCLPGTVFPADDVAKEGGRAFFNKVFYVSEHIMLSHIREITGLDTMALQNWVKRKWVPNPEKKYYNREHLARFLLINMLRDTVQISRILYLLRWLNGENGEDGVIPESELYEYVCRCVARATDGKFPGVNALDQIVEEETADFANPAAGARRRLMTALRIMTAAYVSARIKQEADDMLDSLGAAPDVRRGNVNTQKA